MTQKYICKRLKLLDFLMKRGFEPIDTIPDAMNPKFRWWTFHKTPELMNAVEEYYSMMPTN